MKIVEKLKQTKKLRATLGGTKLMPVKTQSSAETDRECVREREIGRV